MSINLCAQQYIASIFKVSYQFHSIGNTISFLLEWTLIVCHTKIDSIWLFLFLFLAKLRRSIESVLVIKHTHELIEAQWVKCVWGCVSNEIEYEGKRRIKLTLCMSLIKRESLRERIDEATMKYYIKKKKSSVRISDALSFRLSISLAWHPDTWVWLKKKQVVCVWTGSSLIRRDTLDEAKPMYIYIHT
jgi:hypothetical protein